MADRISSFSHTSQLIRDNLRLESEYAGRQLQLSSGLKSNTYDGIASDTNRLLNIESEKAALERQTENAQTVLNRNDVAYSALGSALNQAQSFLADLSSALSGLVSATQIQDNAQQSLEISESALNTSVNGRYLFSGSATQTPPVDINDPAFGGAVIPSVADTSYYQGNSYIQSVEIAEGFIINYGVTADNSAIEQIMRGYDLVRTTPTDEATLLEAFDLINAGIDVLAETRALVSQDSQAIDAQIIQNEEDINLLDNIATELRESDLAEVSVRIQELEVQLEASYSVTTGLLNLNLTDFIR